MNPAPVKTPKSTAFHSVAVPDRVPWTAMQEARRNEVTVLLGKIRDGDEQAADRLFELVYDELRGVAGRLTRGNSDRTLQPTALVHEAWIKLSGHVDELEGRSHFFSVAAKAIRQVLADHARDQRRLKRGGGERPVTWVETGGPSSDDRLDLVVLDDLIRKLEDLHARQARVVELRFLVGLTISEAADVLGISRHTVENDWAMARAWLRRELAPED